MAKIYVLMGKSSSGKDTIYSELRKMAELNLKQKHQTILPEV